MIICLCHRISDRDIAREARAGCTSFDDLQDQLRVGTACGACVECAQDTFAEHLQGAGRRACPGAAACGVAGVVSAAAPVMAAAA